MMLSTVSGGACAAAANGETDNTVTNSIRRIATLLCGRGQGRERIALICAAVLACTSEARPLRLGTTTTVEQSGALKILDSLHPPAVVAVVIGPSGQILRSAAAGDLDVVITHAPSLEQRLLIAPGRATLRCPFVASRFALVGPVTDPAKVAGAATAAEALRRIAGARAPCASRMNGARTPWLTCRRSLSSKAWNCACCSRQTPRCSTRTRCTWSDPRPRIRRRRRSLRGRWPTGGRGCSRCSWTAE